MRNDIVIAKMIDHIDRIQQYTQGMTYETFTDNEMVMEACVFNLSQLGELANKVDKEYEETHSEIPWNNCINPGGCNTNIAEHSGGAYSEEGMGMLGAITTGFPGLKYCDPIDIAKAALFLCSDDARYINGAILPVDNGMSCC